MYFIYLVSLKKFIHSYKDFDSKTIFIDDLSLIKELNSFLKETFYIIIIIIEITLN